MHRPNIVPTKLNRRTSRRRVFDADRSNRRAIVQNAGKLCLKFVEMRSTVETLIEAESPDLIALPIEGAAQKLVCRPIAGMGLDMGC